MNKDKIVVTSGIFDPITLSELYLLQKCKSRGDWLIVGIHSDKIINLKFGKNNHNYEYRREIVENIKCVDEIFRFNDSDGTVCNLLRLVKFCYPLSEITYITDSDLQDTPESKIRGINFEILK